MVEQRNRREWVVSVCYGSEALALVEISCDSLLSESCHRILVKISCLLAAYSAHIYTLPHAISHLHSATHLILIPSNNTAKRLFWHLALGDNAIWELSRFILIDNVFILFWSVDPSQSNICVDERIYTNKQAAL